MELPPSPALAKAFNNKSQLHMLAGEEEPAIEWGNRAIELAERLGVVEVLVHARTNVRSAEKWVHNESGREELERALQIARDKEMHFQVSRCYANLVSACIRFRYYPQAQHWLEEGLEYTIARDLDYFSVYLRGWQAQMYFEMGHWAEAEANAVEALRLSQGESIAPLPALMALGHLKARQGDPTAEKFLDQAQSLALPTGEFQRIGPLATARAEAAWWRGDPGQVAAEAVGGYELALSRNDPWILGQLAFWMWHAGVQDAPIDRLARPYSLMIQGEWQSAAQEWEQIGCPFERAMALMEGDEPAKLEALAIFERLGARPAADILRQELQARGVKIPPR